MVLSTSQLRSAYAPSCTQQNRSMELAYQALDRWLEYFKYKPRSGDTGAYNCRPITGGTGDSLHAFRDDGVFVFFTGVMVTMALAVDINWLSNPYGPRLVTDMSREMVDAILAVRTNSGEQVWGWGGYYSGNKDAMHYEIVCSPSALRTGINPKTLPGSTPAAPVIKESDLSTIDTYAHADGSVRALVIGPDHVVYHYVGTVEPKSLLLAGGTPLPGKWKSVSGVVFGGGSELIWGQGMDDKIYMVIWYKSTSQWEGPYEHPSARALP